MQATARMGPKSVNSAAFPAYEYVIFFTMQRFQPRAISSKLSASIRRRKSPRPHQGLFPYVSEPRWGLPSPESPAVLGHTSCR